MTSYILYGNPLSAPSNKVRMCANALGVDFEFKPINLGKGEQRSPEFLAINPYGKVPALSWDGKSLAESDAIIRYLADQYPSSYVPEGSYERAKLDQWMCYVSQHVGIAVGKVLFNTHVYKMVGSTVDPRSLEEGKALLANYLKVVEEQLGQTRYLLGKGMTLADICLVAFTDPLEVLAFDIDVYPRFKQLRVEIAKCDFYQKCYPSYADMFERITSQAK